MKKELFKTTNIVSKLLMILKMMGMYFCFLKNMINVLSTTKAKLMMGMGILKFIASWPMLSWKVGMSSRPIPML